MTSNLSGVLSAFYSSPWAILPAKLLEIEAYLHRRLRGERPPPEIEAAIRAEAARRDRPTRGSGGVGIINVFGTICQRMGLMEAASGGTSTEWLGQAFDALLQSSSIKTIVLNIDSPGGSVFGVQEVAQKIYDARGDKKTVAVCNSLAASAAYWIASACKEVVCTPSGQAGSIGVLAAHEDHSARLEEEGVKTTLLSAGKYKVEGNPFGPLDKDAQAHMQQQIDQYYDAFTSAVARNRGTTAAAVRSGYGQGRVLNATAARGAGLVDRVDTLETVLGRLGVSSGKPASGRTVGPNMAQQRNRLNLERARLAAPVATRPRQLAAPLAGTLATVEFNVLPRDRQVIPIHEAAHAVAAVVLGIPVEYATLHQVQLGNGPLDRLVQALLAGGAAVRYLTQSPAGFDGGDWDVASGLCHRHPPAGGTKAYLKRQESGAKVLVARHAEAIRRFAAVLTAEQRLDAGRVRDVARWALAE